MITKDAAQKKSGFISKKNDVVDPKEFIREGTILVTRRSPANDIFMDKFLKFVHMSIVANENGEFVVYDLHPDNKNSHGGGLEKRKFDDYMKGKSLTGIYHTGATSERIIKVAQKHWTKKYDTYSFNCQKFIDEITYKEFSSDVYSYYSGIVLASAGALALTAGLIYLLTRKKQ